MRYDEYLNIINNDLKSEEVTAQLAKFYPSKRERTRAFRLLNAVVAGDIKALLNAMNEKSATEFGRKYEIPQRTMSGWVLQQREAPVYVIRLLGFAALTELGK